MAEVASIEGNEPIDETDKTEPSNFENDLQQPNNKMLIQLFNESIQPQLPKVLCQL